MSAGHSYPVHLDLDGRRVLVVGAGKVAAGKIDRLVPTGADITVVAPHAVSEIASRTDVRWHARPYQRGEVASYRLAITCSGDPAVDGQVYADGEAIGVFVNSADDISNCSFTLPAVARRGSVSMSVGTDGHSPALASWLRQRAQAELDNGMTELLELLAAARSELCALNGTSEHPGWHRALDHGLLDLIRRGDPQAAEVQLRTILELPHSNLGFRT